MAAEVLDVFDQPFNGVPLMARGKVRVPLDHAQGLPAAENLNRERIDAFHGQSRGEGVWSGIGRTPRLAGLSMASTLT
jgi:hypothetical protein